MVGGTAGRLFLPFRDMRLQDDFKVPQADKKAVACGGGSRFTPENPIQPAANAGIIRNEIRGTFHDMPF